MAKGAGPLLVGLSAVFFVIIMLWGMVLRARRQLVVSLRDRAERAESEQQLRVAQARVLERTRIAREMHDVLAHSLAGLSVQLQAVRAVAARERVGPAVLEFRGGTRCSPDGNLYPPLNRQYRHHCPDELQPGNWRAGQGADRP